MKLFPRSYLTLSLVLLLTVSAGAQEGYARYSFAGGMIPVPGEGVVVLDRQFSVGGKSPANLTAFTAAGASVMSDPDSIISYRRHESIVVTDSVTYVAAGNGATLTDQQAAPALFVLDATGARRIWQAPVGLNADAQWWPLLAPTADGNLLYITEDEAYSVTPTGRTVQSFSSGDLYSLNHDFVKPKSGTTSVRYVEYSSVDRISYDIMYDFETQRTDTLGSYDGFFYLFASNDTTLIVSREGYYDLNDTAGGLTEFGFEVTSVRLAGDRVVLSRPGSEYTAMTVSGELTPLTVDWPARQWHHDASGWYGLRPGFETDEAVVVYHPSKIRGLDINSVSPGLRYDSLVLHEVVDTAGRRSTVHTLYGSVSALNRTSMRVEDVRIRLRPLSTAASRENVEAYLEYSSIGPAESPTQSYVISFRAEQPNPNVDVRACVYSISDTPVEAGVSLCESNDPDAILSEPAVVDVPKISIFPNPVSADAVTLSASQPMRRLRLMDAHGVLIERVNLHDSRSFVLALDDLPSGVYSVVLYLLDGTTSVRQLSVID